MPGKRVTFDEETWAALDLLARDRMMTFQELADEAFRDLLRKDNRPTGLKEALRKSAGAGAAVGSFARQKKGRKAAAGAASRAGKSRQSGGAERSAGGRPHGARARNIGPRGPFYRRTRSGPRHGAYLRRRIRL
ncbi:MAG: hypothetical protein P8Y53_12670 [Pseudolabrys sp.]|jgi:hypothetical protein